MGFQENYLGEGGELLLEKKFKEIVTTTSSAQTLRKNKKDASSDQIGKEISDKRDDILSSDRSFTANELDLLKFIRKQTYGDSDIPLTDKVINSYKRLLGTVGGKVERHQLIVDLILNLRGWDVGPEERKRIQDSFKERLDDEMD